MQTHCRVFFNGRARISTPKPLPIAIPSTPHVRVFVRMSGKFQLRIEGAHKKVQFVHIKWPSERRFFPHSSALFSLEHEAWLKSRKFSFSFSSHELRFFPNCVAFSSCLGKSFRLHGNFFLCRLRSVCEFSSFSILSQQLRRSKHR